jgi:ABC-type multidrug transport system ATPase subunit/ABC-type multidrug transport system permease subunit
VCLFKQIDKDDQVYFNDRPLILNQTYTLEKGGVLKNPLLGALYYNDIIKTFLHDDSFEKVIFSAKDTSYLFPSGEVGIDSFNLSEQSGQLIGIMGGSGVGKSTLLNLLNGNLQPTTGKVLLNGYNVHTEQEAIEGLIGYVPQDDLLIEELTVFQNLYFNARLCFKDFSREKILRKVQRVLSSLDLSSVRDLKVGSPINKYISGGQRKRLNIALELIREPYVLFVDEPTSGLSSTDSDKVIDLLKHQSLKGKLVIVNIHQPSNDVFKQLDKLIVLDSGGRFVYNGNPQDSLVYFKKYNKLVNAEEGECPTCGNLNPEQILQILEARKVNEFGEYIPVRQVDSKEWFKNYNTTQRKELGSSIEIKSDIPKIDFHIPKRLEQFKIFSLRNFLTKLSDRQFMLINLFEAPVLAFILSWFTKYKAGSSDNANEYIFSGNINIPVYIFMGVVVSIFLGLMLSAEDIIRDRKILKREAFLNLSRFSYFNSKVFFLGAILALQVALFVAIGNSLLKIEGMFFHFWLTLWIASMVSGMVGLNVSATLKSVVAIYILIPVLLVPQILLGGAMIRFDKLNQKLTDSENVPLVGDIMPSRWAYESLMVHQYSKNSYQKLIFEYELEESQASFMLNYYLPEIQNVMSEMKRIATDPGQKNQLLKDIDLINNELVRLNKLVPDCFGNKAQINPEQFNISVFSGIERSVNCARELYISRLSNAIDAKDLKFFQIEKELGGKDKLLELRDRHYNEKLAEIVLNKSDRTKVLVSEDKIIRKVEPIYHFPEVNYGRAHFFAPVKRIGNFYIDTYWFNLTMLLLMGLVFYFTLIYQVFPMIYARINRETISGYVSRGKKRVKDTLKPLLRK